MHADELDLDEALVRLLLAEQFPAWAGLSLRRISRTSSLPLSLRNGTAAA